MCQVLTVGRSETYTMAIMDSATTEHLLRMVQESTEVVKKSPIEADVNRDIARARAAALALRAHCL